MDKATRQEKLKSRYNLIDELRGLTVISMILYHASWDFVYMLGGNWPWYHSNGAYIWQQSICWTFILLSGFCFSMGKKRLQRSLLVFGGGLVITAVTMIFSYNTRIIFGVLTMIGSCMLIMIPLEKLLKKSNPMVGLVVSAGLFFVTRGINGGYLGFESLRIMELPREMYANWVTTYLGFPHAGFFSTDYFSLFPWLFLYIVGYFIYRLCQGRKIMEFLKPARVKPLGFVGRHAIIFYLAHQLVLYAIVELIAISWVMMS